jgi:hypothetical protein
LFALHEIDELRQPAKTALGKAGDECAGIADNAVANMTALVEFQKLEIQGRKFNVMRRCMADYGFVENPQWSIFAMPMAKSEAVEQRISADEALENLRRSHMMHFNETPSQPIYWISHP